MASVLNGSDVHGLYYEGHERTSDVPGVTFRCTALEVWCGGGRRVCQSLPSCDEEQTWEAEKDLAVLLRRIGLLDLHSIAAQIFRLFFGRERIQIGPQPGAPEPVDDGVGICQGMNIGSLPYIDRAPGPLQPRVIILE